MAEPEGARKHRHMWDHLAGSMRCDSCGVWIGELVHDLEGRLARIADIAAGLSADDFEDDAAAVDEILAVARGKAVR